MGKLKDGKTARTLGTSGFCAKSADRTAQGLANGQYAVIDSINAECAVAFNSWLCQGGKNPDQRKSQNNSGHCRNEVRVEAYTVETRQFFGTLSRDFGHFPGSIMRRKVFEDRVSTMSDIEDRRFQTQQKQSHAKSRQRDVRNGHMIPGQSVSKRFKLGHIGRGVDEVAGHRIVSVLPKVLVTSGFSGSCIKFSTIWSRIGKRAIIFFKNNILKGFSRVDTGFFRGQSTLTGPNLASLEGCQGC